MTKSDTDLIGKRLLRIEASVQELRTVGNPALIRSDIREERFFEHTLQIAIQSMLDVASHIVSAEVMGEPRSNHDLIDMLARYRWIPLDLAPTLHAMIGFRNILVHGYETVDLAVVEGVALHRLDDLLGFVRAIRLRMGGELS